MKSTQRAIAAFVALSSIAAAQQYRISTMAGGPPLVAPQSAVSAIGYPIAVATDPAGNVYFSSADLNSVFRLDSNNTLTRVAGNTLQGYTADGTPAANASLSLGLVVGMASPARPVRR